MSSRPVDEKIVKMSLDNVKFLNDLNNTINQLTKFSQQVSQSIDIKTTNFDRFTTGIGSGINGLLSKIPILNKFKSSAEESTDVKTSLFDRFTSGITSGLNGLVSKIPILNKFKTAAQESVNISSAPMDAATSEITSDTSKIASAMSGISNATGNVAEKFSILRTAASVALGNIATKAIETGQHLVSSVSIDKIKEGFQQYNDQTQSIMMLQGALGKGATGEINAALQDLDHYAAVTKYSIGDMNTNLAQFVNNGVKLKDSQIAIKGWGNLAASAGASTQSFGASLQFGVSQALAMGKMTTQNWMSVENAGMATQKFKDALVSQGKEMGKNIDLSGGFRDSLQQGWLTNDVFIATLKKMANDKSMLSMAQDFHTFGEVADAVGEGVVAGWSKVFSSLFGDLDSSTKMWTEFGNMMIDYTSGDKSFFKPLTSEAEKFGASFRSLGGLTAVVKMVQAAFDSLHQITATFSKAFANVFPVSANSAAKSFLGVIQSLTKAFTISKDALATLSSIFMMVFKTIEVGIYLFKQLASVVKNIFPKSAGSEISNYIIKFDSFIIRLDNAILQGKGLKNMFDTLRSGASSLGTSIASLIGSLSNVEAAFVKIAGGAVKGVVQAIKAVAESFKALFSGMGKADVSNLAALSILGTIAYKISGISKNFKDFGDGIKEAGKSISSVFGVFKALPDSLKALTDNVKANTLKQIAISLGILAAAVYVLSTIQVEKLITSMTALVASMKILQGGMVSLVSNPLKIGQAAAASIALNAMATAMLTLSIAIKVLSTMSPAELAKGLLTVSVAMTIMVKAVSSMSSIGPKALIGAAAMLVVAGAINALILPIEIFGHMKTESLAKGLIGLAVGMGILVIGIETLSKIGAKPSLLIGTAAMIGLAFAMNELAVAVKIMGSMSWEQIAKGMTALAGSLTILGVASKLISNPAPLIGMATAMVILSGALKVMGSMSLAQIGKAMIALAGGLTILGVAIRLMGSNVTGALSISIIAAALIPMAMAMKLLGSMSFEQVGAGLIALAGAIGLMVLAARGLQGAIPGVLAFDAAAVGMIAMSLALNMLATALLILSNIPLAKLGVALLGLAGALAIITVAGYAMAGVSLTFIAFGAAAALIGVAIMGVGIGINDLATAFQTLAKINFSVAIKNFKALVDGIISILPTIIKAILDGIGQILLGIVSLSPQIIAAIISLIGDVEAILPSLLSLLLDFIVSLDILVPAIINLGVNIIKGLLQGIMSLSETVGDTLVTVLSVAIDSLSIVIPKMINFALDMVQAFIDGINNHINDFAKTGVNIISNFAIGIIDGITTNIPVLVDHLINAIMTLVNGILDAIGKNVPVLVDKLVTTGIQMITGLATAIETYGPALNAAILKLFGAITVEIIDSFSTILVMFLKPFDKFDGGLSSKVGEMANSAKKAVKSSFSEEEAKELAEAAANGYVAGLSTPVKSAADASAALGTASKSGVEGIPTILGILGSQGGQQFVAGIQSGQIPASEAGNIMKQAAAAGASGGDLTAIAKAFGGTYSNGVFSMSGASKGAGYSLKVNAESGTSGGDASGHGATVGSTYAAGVRSGAQSAQLAGEGLKNNAKAGTSGGNFSGEGSGAGRSFGDGVASQTSHASTAGAGVRDAAGNKLSETRDYSGSSSKIAESYNDGLSGWISRVAATASNIVQSVADIFTHNSPAKKGPLSAKGWYKLARSGGIIVDNYLSGIISSKQKVVEAATAVTQTLADSLQNATENELSFQPTITPVMDLSNIKDVNVGGAVDTSLINYKALNGQTLATANAGSGVQFGDFNFDFSGYSGTANPTDITNQVTQAVKTELTNQIRNLRRF